MAVIEIVETRIHPDLLDTIGRSFNFRHGTGAAEWLKNSLDQYLRLHATGKESRPGSWPVMLNLIDSPSPTSGPCLAVVDFGGTDLKGVEQFLLYWGDTSAATLGRQITANVTGGHGNGGKFYMRQMWKKGARFLTWRDGHVTSLIIERRSDGNSGQWERKDEACNWRAALSYAFATGEGFDGGEWLLKYLGDKDSELLSELDAGSRGFTVVLGRHAKEVASANDALSRSRWHYQKLVDSIQDAPQARRPIRELTISVFVNGEFRLPRLELEEIPDDPDWQSVIVDVPSTLLLDPALVTGAPTIGQFAIRKASVPLVGRHRSRQIVAVVDDHDNPVASYPVQELPLPGHSPLLEFFHGELQLTFPALTMLVQNDRVKLAHSDTTDAILAWVAGQIWKQVQEIEKRQREQSHRSDLEIAAMLNDQLNKHAHRFLEELQTTINIGYVQDPDGGGTGSGVGAGPRREGGSGHSSKPGGAGQDPDGHESGGQGDGGTREIHGGDQPIRRQRFPQVLLSEYDKDPASQSGDSKYLTDLHPPLEQDDIDKNYNVWWINTKHPFADAAIQKGGADGVNFKSYQLHMFRDVVQREALRYRQRRGSELSLDKVENELSDISNRFLSELPRDLVDKLLS